jgi:hypothetical protein
MLKVALVYLGILGLAAVNACALRSSRPESVRPVWNFSFDGQEAKLAYGPPNSDEVGLMLTCAPHAGAVLLSDEVEPGRSTLTLIAGDKRADLRGAVAPDPASGSLLIEAAASLAEPALSAFRDTGRLSVVHHGRRIPMPASSGERLAVGRFFAECA